MFKNHTHSIEHRIVSIHQPHVRPIVRGKSKAKVEFGAKINVSLIDGISFLDELSWEAFNEGCNLIEYIEQYKSVSGFIQKNYWQIKYIVLVKIEKLSNRETSN
ncbi:MAG: hypothetical protein IPO21_09790 [Bacteroidales bacterium]|nr:hypothetical protein [Bacteroidales bacterium]